MAVGIYFDATKRTVTSSIYHFFFIYNKTNILILITNIWFFVNPKIKRIISLKVT